MYLQLIYIFSLSISHRPGITYDDSQGRKTITMHMCLKITILRERLVTLGALIWLVTRVTLHMSIKIATLIEGFVTMSALVWFNTLMTQHMYL